MSDVKLTHQDAFFVRMFLETGEDDHDDLAELLPDELSDPDPDCDFDTRHLNEDKCGAALEAYDAAHATVRYDELRVVLALATAHIGLATTHPQVFVHEHEIEAVRKIEREVSGKWKM
jgi:hypothetical protein